MDVDLRTIGCFKFLGEPTELEYSVIRKFLDSLEDGMLASCFETARSAGCSASSSASGAELASSDSDSELSLSVATLFYSGASNGSGVIKDFA